MCHSGRPIQAGPAAHVVASVPPTEPAPAARDAQGVCPPLEAAASVLASATSRTGDEPHTTTFVRRAAASRDTMLHDWGVYRPPRGIALSGALSAGIYGYPAPMGTAARVAAFYRTFCGIMSALPPKADIQTAPPKCPLMTQSGLLSSGQAAVTTL